jgi:hypothetical protein
MLKKMNEDDYDYEEDIALQMEMENNSIKLHQNSLNYPMLFSSQPLIPDILLDHNHKNNKFAISFESDDEDHTILTPSSPKDKLNPHFNLLKRNSILNFDLPNKRFRNNSSDSTIQPFLEPLPSTHPNTYDILSSLSESTNERKYRKLPPGTKSFVTGCSSDGMDLYFPRKLKSSALNDAKLSNIGKSGTLLSAPIFKLMRELRTDVTEAAIINPTNVRNTGSQLWVNKYQPKRYLDLVGDEVFYPKI